MTSLWVTVVLLMSFYMRGELCGTSVFFYVNLFLACLFTYSSLHCCFTPFLYKLSCFWYSTAFMQSQAAGCLLYAEQSFVIGTAGDILMMSYLLFLVCYCILEGSILKDYYSRWGPCLGLVKENQLFYPRWKLSQKDLRDLGPVCPSLITAYLIVSHWFVNICLFLTR